jgi:hypothetical protein
LGRIALVGIVLLAGVVVAVSGGSSDDPQTPPAVPGLPPPFLGTAVLGDGQLSAAVDSYGDIVDLRDGPVGAGLIVNPAERQAAGTVPSDTGIVPRVSIDGTPPLPLWRADRIHQRYLPDSNALKTEARFDGASVAIVDAVRGSTLARVVRVSGSGQRLSFSIEDGLDERLLCHRRRAPSRLSLTCWPREALRSAATPGSQNAAQPSSSTLRPEASAAGVVAASMREDRGWLARGRPLGDRAPAWAREMYERSLLALRTLTDRRTGAVAAGLRDGWAYVWPRDAAAVSLALAAAGYRDESRKVEGFLSRLDLNAGARFDASGAPIEGREAQGDAWGWTAAAARAAGLTPPHPHPDWRDHADYQEKSPGDYLGNALASASGGANRIQRPFGTNGVLMRAGPGSGVDSAAAWAVRPFTQPPLFPTARRSLQRLIATRGGRFGIVPSEDWPDEDPWTAPTAWTAWAFAALSRRSSSNRHSVPDSRTAAERRAPDDRRVALRLLADLRRAATPAGMLPERVDAQTGIFRSTTPLAWSHAFTVLALRELWPSSE